MKPNNTVYISVQLSTEEREILDAAVAAIPEMTRNRFIRDWIASLARRDRQ